MAERNQDPLQDWFDRKRQERINELQAIASRQSSTAEDGGRSNIDALRQLMEKNAAMSSSDSAQPNPRHQPEMQQAILVEVRGLFETRPVSNMLHSPHFRRELEGIVRASVNAARESRPRAESVISQSSSTVSLAVPPQTQSAAQQTSSQRQAVQPTHVPSPPPPPPSTGLPAQDSINSGNFIDGLQREQLVVDISELLHTRLVSSTLSSGFRDQLENLMQSNFVTPDGARNSIQALSQLPPSNHVRNDFSHLGIHNPNLGLGLDSDTDSVSIISAAAARVPVSQTSFGMGRELAAMRTEMKEMQKMLKMVLDMQSDLHRAVRQEVAAAMAVSSPESYSISMPAPSRPTQAAGRCLICLTSMADTMAYRCGHLCMCNTCALSLGQHQNGRQTCPVCRAPIQDLVRVYVCDH